MNVLAIYASPYGRKGFTARICTPFLEGIRNAGGTVETIFLTNLDIKSCKGDLSCWFKTKNRCIQNDDMTPLIPKFKEADIIVVATPVYCDGVPGHLKVMMDRLVVIGNPFMELREGHTRHPIPPGVKPKKFVLVASCGLWETDNFIPMITHFKAFCRNLGMDYCASLLRPHSFAMKNNQVNDILRAVKSAGRELIEKDSIDQSLLDTVKREIIPCDEYMEKINEKAAVYLG